MAQARFDDLREVVFSAIGPAYGPLGAPLANTVKAFRIVNTTDAGMFVSTDGINKKIYVPPVSFVLWDISANATPVNVDDKLELPINTQISLRYETVPTFGSVFMEALHAQGE